MEKLRNLSATERERLLDRACSAESWDDILVSEDFVVEQLWAARLAGRVEIGSQARIHNSYVANYRLLEGSNVDGVARLECRQSSCFGQGTQVATINENGGRTVAIYENLSAQTAYLWAMMRHREALNERLNVLVDDFCNGVRSTLGRLGRGSQIIASQIVRECDFRDGVTVEGATLLENGTLLSGARVGVGVIARDFILCEDALLDSAAQIKRCFVGECAIVASAFAAVDSLLFSSSHLENGEAASIFAGPYTVSHHRSSLLIAGMFSFFNAGSGSNQSNHLFKSGAVHQIIHARGVKFASGAYVMAPAREGAFTMVKGSHSRHHDTSAFPYSYLIENSDGVSTLMPGANLTSCGTKRDIEKWGARDKRKVKRDVINYEEHNPTITAAMLRAVNAINSLLEGGVKDEYIWERVTIRSSQLTRGLSLYNKAIAAAIGAMLRETPHANQMQEPTSGDWIDLSGGYFPLSLVEQVMDDIESGKIGLADVDCIFQDFAKNYTSHAYAYAHALLTQLLGHTPTAQELEQTISAAQSAAADLQKLRAADLRRDCSTQMAIGYGCDYADQDIRDADFKVVRNL